MYWLNAPRNVFGYSQRYAFRERSLSSKTIRSICKSTKVSPKSKHTFTQLRTEFPNCITYFLYTALREQILTENIFIVRDTVSQLKSVKRQNRV